MAASSTCLRRLQRTQAVPARYLGKYTRKTRFSGHADTRQYTLACTSTQGVAPHHRIIASCKLTQVPLSVESLILSYFLVAVRQAIRHAITQFWRLELDAHHRLRWCGCWRGCWRWRWRGRGRRRGNGCRSGHRGTRGCYRSRCLLRRRSPCRLRRRCLCRPLRPEATPPPSGVREMQI